jgi:hypothetical protein
MSIQKPLAVMHTRRSLLRPDMEITLHEDRLEAAQGGRLEKRIALSAVRRAHLTVEVAGRRTQVVCRVSGPHGAIVFSSRYLVSPGEWRDEALAFSIMLTRLHEQLRPRFDEIEFREGASLALRLALAGTGLAMAAGGAVFAVWMLTARGSALLAFAAAPFILTGAALAWVFRPAVPPLYDPEKLIARFASAARSSTGA